MRCWIEDGYIMIYVHEYFTYDWNLEQITDNDSALEFLDHIARKSWGHVSLIIELADLIKSKLGYMPDLYKSEIFTPTRLPHKLLCKAFRYLS